MPQSNIGDTREIPQMVVAVGDGEKPDAIVMTVPYELTIWIRRVHGCLSSGNAHVSENWRFAFFSQLADITKWDDDHDSHRIHKGMKLQRRKSFDKDEDDDYNWEDI